jgi:hypothetical protein
MELVRYNAAKAALAECADIDECKAWADKGAALAAYGKQVNDEELEKNAKRIRARAYQRMGQLLKEIPAAKTGPKIIKKLTASETQRIADAAAETSRAHAARAARISEKRQATALQIANVPEDEFEAAVEADKPATVKVLAERGRKRRRSRPGDEGLQIGRAIKEFNKWWTRWQPHVGKLKGVDDAVKELIATLHEWR